MGTSLLGMDTFMWVGIGAAGAVALFSVFYGIFKKFVRMSWTSWQILVVFGLSLLLEFIPLPEDELFAFAIGAGYLVGSIVLVLVIGAVVRRYMLQKKTQSNLFIRFCNRFLGAFTAVLNFVVLALVLGGFVIGLMGAYAYGLPELEPIYSNPIWREFAVYHVRDLMLIACCFFFVRGGYRIGVARSIQTVLMVLLTLGALVLSVFLCITQAPLRAFVDTIAASMQWTNLDVVINVLIAFFVAVFILFLVFFAVILVLGYFLNKLVRKYRSLRVVGVIDGILLSVVFTAVFLVLECGMNFLVSGLTDGSLAVLLTASLQPEAADTVIGYVEAFAESFAEYAAWFGTYLGSSPIGRFFYEFNPIRILMELSGM